MLAETLYDVAVDFGIEDRAISVTCDNATSNDDMVDELEIMLPSFKGQHDRTRCFAHIINLVAKSLLKMFDPPKKTRGNEEAEDDTERDADDEVLAIDVDELLVELGDIEREMPDRDDEDDVFDELADMGEFERGAFQEKTREVRTAIGKASYTIN